MGSEEILCHRAPDRDLVSFDGFGQRRRIAQQRPTVKMNKRLPIFPIIFFQIYLATSVLTFAFGPWQWPVSNPWQLYSFLILAQVALLAGYLKAIKKQPRPASTKLRVPVAVTRPSTLGGGPPKDHHPSGLDAPRYGRRQPDYPPGDRRDSRQRNAMVCSFIRFRHRPHRNRYVLHPPDGDAGSPLLRFSRCGLDVPWNCASPNERLV